MAGHHKPTDHHGEGSKAPKHKKSASGHKPSRGNYVMEGGAHSHADSEHKAANSAFGMSGGFDGGADHMHGHCDEGNEECD